VVVAEATAGGVVVWVGGVAVGCVLCAARVLLEAVAAAVVLVVGEATEWAGGVEAARLVVAGGVAAATEVAGDTQH